VDPLSLAKAALARESAQFQQSFQWLQESFPNLLELFSVEELTLIVHSLIQVLVEETPVHFRYKEGALVVCRASPDSDQQILNQFPTQLIATYETFTSSQPHPQLGIPLRVARLRWETETRREHEVATNSVVDEAKESDSCRIHARCHENAIPSLELLVAWRDAPRAQLYQRLVQVLRRHQLLLIQGESTELDGILRMRLFIHGANGKPAWECTDLASLQQDLGLIQAYPAWDTLTRDLVKPDLLTGHEAAILSALVRCIHQFLVHIDPNIYRLDQIRETFGRHPDLTRLLMDAFHARLHPDRHDATRFQELCDQFLGLIANLETGHEAHDLRRKTVLRAAIHWVESVQKTNCYRLHTTALSFRIDPAFMDTLPFERQGRFPELPFGIFFICGDHFLGFHVRFRDLARGGVRTIFPLESERLVTERDQIFGECYDLALTQQRKNKELAEGGAKAVLFLEWVEPLAAEEALVHEIVPLEGPPLEAWRATYRLRMLHACQRRFIESLLVLVNCEEDGTLRADRIVDLWRQPEYLYLGPDENMHNVTIEWIAQTSKRHNYLPGGALITGRSTVGINHKQFGVTSHGLHCYVEALLRYIGIDPSKQPFRVKMAGGPDGDVAGNAILNLARHCPHTAKLIALTDVSGTINDPLGLDLNLLTQLFQQEKPIRFYPPDQLHEGGFLLDLQSRRLLDPHTTQVLCWRKQNGQLIEDWLSGSQTNKLMRTNVHQTPADIFIPAGGRPQTLKESTWRNFLTSDGKPTALAIAEGANLYLTPAARHHLEELGVLIFKDSSANKGGVICSSYEVLCMLALGEELFTQHKTQLVEEILQIIATRCNQEATLLLEAHRTTNQPLTRLSDALSVKINTTKDLLLAHLTNEELTPALIRCFLAYCPPLLRTLKETTLARVPLIHQKAAIAAHIAAQLYYTHGLDWSPNIIDSLPLILEDPAIIGDQPCP
jgi:glutamate dehydrogenase